MKPKLTEMDKNPPEYVNGRVKVHPMVRGLMKECGEGGWIGAPFSFDLGGQQLPLMISGAVRFILSAANYSASVYPFLTTGAAHLIVFRLEMIEATSRNVRAEAGTMALTEPQAGSSLLTSPWKPCSTRGPPPAARTEDLHPGRDHDGVERSSISCWQDQGALAASRDISLWQPTKTG
jgi:butyryl-CoA dehydrogenase